MNEILSGDLLMPNGDGYNPEFCKRIHKEVDRRLDKGEQERQSLREFLDHSIENMNDRIDKFNNKLNYIILFLVANFLGAFVTILISITTGN